MAATQAAVTATQIAAITSAPTPEFAEGGILSGKSHAQGGMAVINHNGTKVAEIEGGEAIIPKRVVSKQLPLIRSLIADRVPSVNFNMIQRNRMFAQGGIMSNSGERATNKINSVADPNIAAMRNDMQMMMNAINAWQRNFTVELPLNKLEEAQNKRLKIQNRAKS